MKHLKKLSTIFQVSQLSKLEKFPHNLIVVFLAWLTTYTQVIFSGRASRSLVYDDISYIRSGAMLVLDYDSSGINSLGDWFRSPPHSIWSEGIAALGLRISNLDQWGPYFVNSIAIALLFFFLSQQFCMSKIWVSVLTAILILSPIGYLAFDQFRPDIAFIIIFIIFCKKIFLNNRQLQAKRYFRELIIFTVFFVLIKPTWFAFALVFVAFSLIIYVISWKTNDNAETKKYCFLLFLEWTLFALLYWEHIYNYVFMWALGGSGSTPLLSGGSAIRQSIQNAAAYLGPSIFAGLCITSLVLISLVTIRNKNTKLQLSNITLMAVLIILLMVPVFKSGMPSPFQGLLWFLPIILIPVGLYFELLEKEGKYQEVFLVSIVFVLIFSLFPYTKIGESAEVNRPVNSIEKISEVLVQDCLSQHICENLRPATKIPRIGLLAFGEVSPEGIQFYSISRGVLVYPQLLDLSKELSSYDRNQINAMDYIITFSSPNRLRINENWILDNSYLESLQWDKIHLPASVDYLIWRNSKYKKLSQWNNLAPQNSDL